jgi:hypothetical protein
LGGGLIRGEANAKAGLPPEETIAKPGEADILSSQDEGVAEVKLSEEDDREHSLSLTEAGAPGG